MDRWEDLPPRDGILNPGYKLEWENFQHDVITDYLGWQAKIVNEYKRPDQFITHDFSGGVHTNLDQWAISNSLDIVAENPYFETQGQLNGRTIWLSGDLGRSLRYRQPALPLVLERLPATAELALAALFVSLLVAIPAGVISAVRRDTAYDNLTMLGALFGQSMPVFWLGIMLILIFSVRLELLPTSGRGGLDHLILPAVTLGLYSTARVTRLVRAGMLDVIGQDYIRTAQAKGLPDRRVIVKHALRNTLIPVVTIIGLELGTLLGGAVITETIFAWPGIGRLAVTAIFQRDYPLVQATVLVTALVFVLSNLLVDLLYGWLDPRIRYT